MGKVEVEVGLPDGTTKKFDGNSVQEVEEKIEAFLVEEYPE